MSYAFNPFSGKLDYYKKYRVPCQSAAPSNPQNGDLYFDTDDNTLYLYYGSWIAIGSTGTPSTYYFTLEDSSGSLLAETGDLLRQE